MRIISSGIISRRDGLGAYMPTIAPLADGSWIATQHVGQKLASSDNRIECLISSDEGATWKNLGNILDDDDGFIYRAPKVAAIPDGRLLVAADRFRQDGGALFDLKNETLARPEILLFWSHDSGITWSEPQIVPVDLPAKKYTWNGTGPVLQVSSSRWMYTLETWKPEGYAGPPDQKSAAVFSSDGGKSWGELTVTADDLRGRLMYYDQMGSIAADGRICIYLWTHVDGTSEDLTNHWIVSSDEGRTWSAPKPTNLRGQVCAPIALEDGRIAAVYNFRHNPQGVRIALSEDLQHFDLERELVLFEAGSEATMGAPAAKSFHAEHVQIAFGKPGGLQLPDGDLLTYFWCTSKGVTHTRWVRLAIDA